MCERQIQEIYYIFNRGFRRVNREWGGINKYFYELKILD